VTLSGLTGTKYPDDVPGQKEIYQPLVLALVTQLLGQDKEFELFTRRGQVKRGTLPPVEIDLKDTQLAIKFRTEGARLSRAKQPGFASLFFNPTVTLATRYDTAMMIVGGTYVNVFILSRVRAEILKVLSGKVSSSMILSYCVTNGPRPKLSVGPAAGKPGKRISYFYAEAIKKYGHLLDDSVLDKAYDRCQMFFTGDTPLHDPE
jgi:hypothetical protein